MNNEEKTKKSEDKIETKSKNNQIKPSPNYQSKQL